MLSSVQAAATFTSAEPPFEDPNAKYDPPPYPPPDWPFVPPSRCALEQTASHALGPTVDHELRCQWGLPVCGEILRDGTTPTVRAHLRERHGIGLGLARHSGKQRIQCLWGGKCTRTDTILSAGMGKHVATCHLKSTRRSCEFCGQVFCRPDSLARHDFLYCARVKELRGGGNRRRSTRKVAAAATSDGYVC